MVAALFIALVMSIGLSTGLDVSGLLLQRFGRGGVSSFCICSASYSSKLFIIGSSSSFKSSLKSSGIL